ncbi:MAG TPA: PAS domain S-box protein, partial [Bacteroidales bacterium]|nr:PAS domain S-box protein [Bacteroidales bacterium]
QAVIQEKNLNEIFRVIHEKMEILFNTRNFFVALYNKEKNILYIPYYKDERDGRSILDPDRSLTGYMIKKGNPLFLNPDDILKISSEMGIERSTLGAQSKIWMGVPMYSNGEVTGALVVQDYENPDAYTPKDLDFLKFLANQLSLIIEQKKAEEELNLRARLLDVATDSIYMHTADGLISYVNETAVTLTGISLNDIRKSNFYKLFDRAAQASLKEKIKQVSEENDLYLSTLHQTADGKEFPVEIHSKAIVINGEKRILSVVRDITELVKSQDENNKLSEAVLQSPVGVVIALPDGKVEFINPMYYQITGYSPEDIAPYRHSVFDLIPHLQPGKRAEIRNMINNVGRWQYETQSRKKNGELFWESISFSPVKDRNGRFSHYLMINEDITEKKITEKQLIEAKNRAEESDRLKSAFLTNMSHEIRTPLNAIAGFTQLITDNNFSTEKKAGFSHQIKNATLDLISLVSNIIETSKLQSGRIPYEKEKFFVKNLLEEIYIEAIELRDRKEKKHLEIVLQIGVSDQRVMFTDPNKLKQILINLIDNAIKFTEKGQIELGCTLHDSEKICFHVKDTGIGISKKHQKEIFGSFQKVEESGQKLYRGAGLGLTLCQGLTKLLDGEIHVDSQPDRGAEFNVLFPLEENQFEVFTSSVPNKVKNKPQKLKGKKILVAEDVPSNFQYLKELSEQLGLILLEATDGNEAIEKVKETKDIDLILMDILMPEKDGFEAARQIRKMNKSIPIIAQSAFKWNENKKSVYRGVFDDYLTKPFSEEQLTSLLMRHLL